MSFDKFILILVSVFMLNACRSVNSVTYLSNAGDNEEFTNPVSLQQNYAVRPYDILHVTVTSYNKEMMNFFNAKSNAQYQQGGKEGANVQQVGANFFFNGYTVDRNGEIELPLVGKVLVKNLSTEEVKVKLTETLRKKIEDINVEVKFVSFNITLLGEIGRKGIMNVFNERINMLEAIAMAGGITDYGNKKDMLLIRATEQGSKAIPIDLTNKSLLSSEYFYLQPNDVLIVKPVKTKLVRLNFTDYSTFLSTISATITTIVLIINLNKADGQ